MAAWIAGLTGFLFASAITPSYEARTRLLVGPVTADLNTLRASAGLVPTFAELAQSEPAVEAIIAQLGIDLPEAVVSERLSITANDTTRVLTIRFDDTDPQRVAAVPNALAQHLIALQPAGSVLPEGEITVVEPATVPAEPAAPDVPLLIVLAAAAGLVGALIMVMLLEYANRTIRDASEIELLTDLPLLGAVRLPPSRSRRGAVSPLFVESMPASRSTAAIRIAAVKATSGTAAPVRSLLVIGIDTASGPGQLAANLAAAISQSGQRVTLVDASEDSGEATTLMAAVDLPGTAELLDDAEDGTEIRISDVVLQRWAGIDVIPRGSGVPRTLNPARVTKLLAELSASNDLTIVTASPVHVSGGALVWGRACDATVVVPRRDGTNRESFTDAIESLRLVGARPSGVILYERPSSLMMPSIGGAAAAQRQRAQAVALDADTVQYRIARARDARPDAGPEAAPSSSKVRRQSADGLPQPPDGSAR